MSKDSYSKQRKKIPGARSKRATNLNPTTEADSIVLQSRMRIALREQQIAAWRTAKAIGVSYYPIDKKAAKGKFTGEFILPRPKDWDSPISPSIRVDVKVRNFESDRFSCAMIEKPLFEKITKDKKPILYIEVYSDDTARIWDLTNKELLFHTENIQATTVVKSKAVKKMVGELNYSDAKLVKLTPLHHLETPYKKVDESRSRTINNAKSAQKQQNPLF